MVKLWLLIMKIFIRMTRMQKVMLFKPAYCLNFATGEVWFGGGKAKINADGSGYLANKKLVGIKMEI